VQHRSADHEQLYPFTDAALYYFSAGKVGACSVCPDVSLSCIDRGGMSTGVPLQIGFRENTCQSSGNKTLTVAVTSLHTCKNQQAVNS
jgi:hypothetical protein